MRKYALVALFFIVVVVTGFLLVRSSEAPSSKTCNPGETLEQAVVTSGNQSIQVEIASTGEQKAQGLSGRNCLDAGSGMLFTYELSGDYCYWMKDMKFDIDMIWLDEDKTIVTVKDNVSPDTYPQSFCPDRPASFVIELAAGMAAKYDWQVGTQLSF